MSVLHFDGVTVLPHDDVAGIWCLRPPNIRSISRGRKISVTRIGAGEGRTAIKKETLATSFGGEKIAFLAMPQWIACFVGKSEMNQNKLFEHGGSMRPQSSQRRSTAADKYPSIISYRQSRHPKLHCSDGGVVLVPLPVAWPFLPMQREKTMVRSR